MKKKIIDISIYINCTLIFIILGGCQFFSPPPPLLEWEIITEEHSTTLFTHSPNEPEMIKLRTKYQLEKLVAESKTEYERLKSIVKWSHTRWAHNGSNEPSHADPLTILKEASEGAKFRCVEYAIIVAACARSIGMPSRVLSLRRKDVETAKHGAGHVVTEVWLNQFQKWVMVDAQFDAIPEMHGVPLNAVEFQRTISQKNPGLLIRSSSELSQRSYIKWISPYLYYFQFSIDQRFFLKPSEKIKGKKMLVPKGAKKPTVFQRKYPIKNCIYISNPDAFYSVTLDKS